MPKPLQRTYTNFPDDWQCVTARGANNFVTQAVFRAPDGTKKIWESRRHRKGRGLQEVHAQRAPARNPWLQFIAPQKISWWVTIGFIAGSICFTLAAASALFFPRFFSQPTASGIAEWSYFIGAIFFTVAIYLQILESINADKNAYLQDQPRQPFRWWAWQFRRLSFVSSLILLIGSLFFNLETTCALLGLTTVYLTSLPSLLGAICFVVYSYLALVEVCHSYWQWKPRSIEWWVQIFNLVGSLGFFIGAIFGFEIPGLSAPQDELIVKVTFFQGSICFLIGSYLMLPEMFSP